MIEARCFSDDLLNAARLESAPYRGVKDQWQRIHHGRAWTPVTPFQRKETQMAAKTKTITVQVDERLASEIEGTTVHNWRTTTFASGKRRVYATFESVKTVGGMK